MTAPATGAAPRAATKPTTPVVRFTIRGVERTPTGLGMASQGCGRPFTVVYDGNCKVCGRLVKVLRAWDTQEVLEIVSSQQPGVQARFPWIPARAYTESVQFIARDGRTWQGARAIEEIIDALPKGRFITWVFSIPFVRPLAEKFYRWFARNRYKLGCGEHCQLRAEQLDYLGEAK
jgi:predicted DCC family thiol-disulfide oxidoreductase YuxK